VTSRNLATPHNTQWLVKEVKNEPCQD